MNSAPDSSDRRIRTNERSLKARYPQIISTGELTTICKAAPAEHGPMNTRALVTHILAVKWLDSGDRVAKSVAERLIHALMMQAKRGKIAVAGKERVNEGLTFPGAGPGISVVFEAHPRQKMTAVWQKCVARRSLN